MSHETPASPQARHMDRMLLVILLVGLLVRGGMLWQYRETLTRDDDNYGEIATNVKQHGVYGLGRAPTIPTAFRPPLYPLLLAATMFQDQISPLQVGLLHLGISLLTILLTYRLAHRYHLGRAAPLAALLVILDPVLLYQSTRIMTETLATFLVLLSLYGLSRLHDQRHCLNAFTCGILIGLTILCRPTFLAWFVLCTLTILIVESHWRKRLLISGSLLLGAALTLAPWTLRNLRQFQEPIALTTHGGYTLLLGNNPIFFKHLQEQSWGTVWSPGEVERFKQGLLGMHPNGDPTQDYWATAPAPIDLSQPATTEYERDRFTYRVAIHQILKHPADFFRACMVRVGRLWSPLPHRMQAHETQSQQALRYMTACWYASIYMLAIVGLIHLKKHLLQPPWIWGLLLVLTLTAVHALFWSNIRMRAPLIPWVNMLAAMGAWKMMNRSFIDGPKGSHRTVPASDLKS